MRGRKTVQVHGVTCVRTLGKAGFIATTQKHFCGSTQLHLETIQARATAVIDQMPWSGAWQRKDGDRRVV